MKRNVAMLLVGFSVAVLFVLLQVLFIIREGEAAVVTTFGRPDREITNAGLYARWPWPVQRVHLYDARVRSLETALQEAMTQDGRNVIVSLYAGWRVDRPVRFLERVGTVAQAEANLDGLLRNFLNSTLGQFPFSALVNASAKAVRIEEIEERILAAARPEALERYGVDVKFVGLRRLGLPESITGQVFERMRAEREALAARYRAEGEGEAIRLRAEADSRRDQLLAQAEADAKRLRAEGDAEAAEHYRAFEQNPELAMFLRKLEVLEETLKDKSTVVLGADTEPYDLLRGVKALPQK
jgi:membrane protease subunit HflC